MTGSRYIVATTRKVAGGQFWGVIYWRPAGDARREAFVEERSGFRSSEDAAAWAKERVRALPAGGPGA